MFRLTVFFSLSFNGSTSLKAIMHQITENVSKFIYYASQYVAGTVSFEMTM